MTRPEGDDAGDPGPWAARVDRGGFARAERDLDPEFRWLVLIVGAYCGRKRSCWVREGTLGDRVGVGERTIQRQFTALSSETCRGGPWLRRVFRDVGRKPRRLGTVMLRRIDRGPVARGEEEIISAEEELIRELSHRGLLPRPLRHLAPPEGPENAPRNAPQ